MYCCINFTVLMKWLKLKNSHYLCNDSSYRKTVFLFLHDFRKTKIVFMIRFNFFCTIYKPDWEWGLDWCQLFPRPHHTMKSVGTNENQNYSLCSKHSLRRFFRRAPFFTQNFHINSTPWQTLILYTRYN